MRGPTTTGTGIRDTGTGTSTSTSTSTRSSDAGTGARDSGTPTRPDIAIRARRADDLDACARALSSVHVEDGYPVDWPEDPARWLARDAALGSWVATLDGQVVGHVSLSRGTPEDLAPTRWQARSGTPPEGCAVVGRLFVSPSARGHGLGARLLACATDAAHAAGLRPALDVVAKDTAAVALYERHGWERLDTVPAPWAPGREVTVHCYVGP